MASSIFVFGTDTRRMCSSLSHWGSKLLGGMNVKQKAANKKNSSPGQLSLPWNQCQVLENPQVEEIAEKFTRANCFKR